METGGREGRREGRKLGRSEVAGAQGVYLGGSGWGAHSGRGSPAPAAMDEERALYIVRAGEAGAIERVLRDYSDKVKSSSPGRSLSPPPPTGCPRGLHFASSPPPLILGMRIALPRKRFRLGHACLCPQPFPPVHLASTPCLHYSAHSCDSWLSSLSCGLLPKRASHTPRILRCVSAQCPTR